MTKNPKLYTTIGIKISPLTNQSKLDKLNAILKRDTKALKSMTSIILNNIDQIKETNGKFDKYDLDNLFLSTEARKVPYNIRDHFNIYAAEYQEIRDNAYENAKSYLESSNKNKSIPFSNGKNKLFSRRMRYQKLRDNGKRNVGTCYIKKDSFNSISSLWLHTSYSLVNKFNKNGNCKRVNSKRGRGGKRLDIPLADGDKFRKFMRKYNLVFNDICTVTITYDHNEWICHLTFGTPSLVASRNPKLKMRKHKIPNALEFAKKDRIAVFGYDPGLRIPYTGVILTPNALKNDYIRLLKLPDAQRMLHRLDKRISKQQSRLCLILERIKSSLGIKLNGKDLKDQDNKSLQKLKNKIRSQLRNSTNKNNKNINKNRDVDNLFYLESQLTKLVNSLERSRHKWFAIRQQSEYLLAQAIQEEVLVWEMQGWKVHVVIGYPKGIKEQVMHIIKSKVFRRQTSRWRYKYRLILLKHALERYGIKEVHFVNEAYTSRTCSKCGTTEFRKFKNQSNMRKWSTIFRHGGYFECLVCGCKANADVNAAINICKQYMLTKVFKPDKQELNRCRRRNHYHVAEELFQRRLQRYERMDSVTQQKMKKPMKNPNDEWELIRKRDISKLRQILWFKYPTSHIPKVWKIWFDSIQTAQPVLETSSQLVLENKLNKSKNKEPINLP